MGRIVGSTATMVPLPSDLRWARSGAMALTGRAGGPPLLAPISVAPRVAFLAGVVHRASTRVGHPVVIDGLALLGERAAIAGFTRRGDRSCGGSARLLPAADGWVAVSLARDDDEAAVPAWLGVNRSGLAEEVAVRPAREVVDRAALLGIPAARLAERSRGRPVRATPQPGGVPSVRPAEPVVVDLSSLWAGPLCTHLLQRAGCRVVKVESAGRPDGARAGPAAFFDLLHGGQESVSLDFRDPTDRGALGRLLAFADVVVEGSRPRALAQLGISPNRVFSTGRARAWVSITGYGRDGPDAHRVAFGDDAAVAGGLVVWDEAGPSFCADAIADPAAGLVAAAAALTALADGRRWLIDVALRDAAAFLAGPDPACRWLPAGAALPAAPPRARPVITSAPALGQHTEAVLAEIGARS